MCCFGGLCCSWCRSLQACFPWKLCLQRHGLIFPRRQKIGICTMGLLCTKIFRVFRYVFLHIKKILEASEFSAFVSSLFDYICDCSIYHVSPSLCKQHIASLRLTKISNLCHIHLNSFDINGDCYLAALMNSFIHVCMYGHYFLSSFGVKAWRKRYLTQMQLLQFVICWVQPIYAFYSGSSCGYKDWLKLGMIVYQTTMFVLFTHFYKKSYNSKKKKSA